MPQSIASPVPQRHAIVIGGGPAGLMAAERLQAAGLQVDVYDAMPSVGRKFLLAGKGGLNLTHSEPEEQFNSRFAERCEQVSAWLRHLDGPGLRRWAEGLGVETFVGSSGRVFPVSMKAAPLLRAWLSRLRESGVRFHMRHHWLGWNEARELRFAHGGEEITVAADVLVLALGGASWPQLGSNAGWVPVLAARGVDIAGLRPANCGFDLGLARAGAGRAGWSPLFVERFAGLPVKPVALYLEGRSGRRFERQGEFVITASGIEGSLIYAASALLRDEIEEFGEALIHLDLLPDRSVDFVSAEVARPRGSRSMSTHLKSRLGIEGLKAGLLHEVLSKEEYGDPMTLAAVLKRLPLRLAAPRPMAEAISTAGGVRLEGMDGTLMLQQLPGVFCAGEMLDWEAPTGGYLLTASMASGWVAGEGAAAYLRQR
ncbi:TIGR03862 family flavoprotein [Paucibacter sp. APW11]|uniref:TIGR03862 family flavoprotein n=1 Tax=Roseateles aquae TaxID=3077235 RepID=A0ABU3P932_9BURK|nr:TIGR03862 family flavoprotein [Paucibacter sp. APW11]MDT8998588.1 TIGR03862 family flavoprotein [Paucibacter sp. APW11]